MMFSIHVLRLWRLPTAVTAAAALLLQSSLQVSSLAVPCRHHSMTMYNETLVFDLTQGHLPNISFQRIPPTTISRSTQFHRLPTNLIWIALFADYHADMEAQLEADWIPVNCSTSYSKQAAKSLSSRCSSTTNTTHPSPKRGYFLEGFNHSDDLWMGLVTRIRVPANTTFHIHMRARFASNSPRGCLGIGGSPGDSVYVKLGALDRKPEIQFDEEHGIYRLSNVDKGNQAKGGRDLQFSGIYGSAQLEDCLSDTNWAVENRGKLLEWPVRSSPDGYLWLVMGTDSGFEGITSIYWHQLWVHLRQVE